MTIIFAVIIFFLLIVLLACVKKTKNNKSSTQQKGLSYIIQIKVLISLIQQHRGLNSTWLNGEKQVETKLVLLKKDISMKIKALNIEELSHHERWLGFCDHWQRLLQLNNQLTVKNSFEQHTHMIRNLAYLLEDTAEEYYLTANYVPLMPNIGYVWRELLLAAENIGQSRALGIGVVVQKECSSVDKIRLNFLIQNITTTSNAAFEKLSYLPAHHSKHQVLIEAARKHITRLVDVIDKELVNSAKITLVHADYFTLATESMEQLNKLFDHQIEQINNVLN